MGGPGSGRLPKEETLVRMQDGPVVTVGNEILDLPNYSGLKAGAKKTEELSGDADSLSGAAKMVGIITHTSATPPTASKFPQGTLYIQYTA
jgi:hypothetical protein